MAIRAPTAEELKKLELIDRTRKQAVPVALLAGLAALFIGRMQRHEDLKILLMASAVLIMLATVIYVSFCLRCPRCSGWIAIARCPACGLGKPGSGK